MKRLGFSSLAECLLCTPSEYLDFTRPTTIVTPTLLGRRLYVALKVVDMALWNANRERCSWGPFARRLVVSTVDERGVAVDVVVFGNLWDWKGLAAGMVAHVYGDVGEFRGQLQVAKPRLVQQHERGRLCPVYPGKRGQVKGETVGEKVAVALPQIETATYLMLAQAGLRATEFQWTNGFKDAQDFLRALHCPSSVEEGSRAIGVAKALSAEAMVRQAVNARARRPSPASAIAITQASIDDLVGSLPFQPTTDQRTAMQEIVDDLRSPYPMRRLLSGDVNTGKSITFMVPAVAAHRAGASVAILAPSVLVVRQLCQELREYFPGVETVEVTAGVKTGSGINVGTTALINAAKKESLAFDLVIMDEQQKFSVGQKSSIVDEHTNVLEATATAIPRTLALVQFGGMDVSMLRTAPVRRRVSTHITSKKCKADRDRLESYFYAALQKGFQLAVIYPQVATSETAREDLSPKEDDGGYNTVQAAAKRWEKSFPGQVGCLHGRMDAEEKANVIDRMKAKEFKLLISSIVIEVGVTLPSLKAMMIVSPERYGLSQLHQLRGRPARKGGHGRLFLHVDDEVDKLWEEQPDLMRRLQSLVECEDGFELAERDMELRGFGDVQSESNMQSGRSRTLFWGVKLTPTDLREAGMRMGVDL